MADLPLGPAEREHIRLAGLGDSRPQDTDCCLANWQTSRKQKSSLSDLSHRGKEYVVSAEIARPMTATGLADVRLISGAAKGPQFPYKWIIPSFIFLIHHLPDSPAICDRRTKFLSSLDSPLPSATLRYLLCGIDSLSSALQRWQTPDLAINGTLVTVLYIQIAVARQSLRLLPSIQFPRIFKRRLPYENAPHVQCTTYTGCTCVSAAATDWDRKPALSAL